MYIIGLGSSVSSDRRLPQILSATSTGFNVATQDWSIQQSSGIMRSLPNNSGFFQVLTDTRPDDVSLPAFMVSTTRGFLPRADPITSLPPKFAAVESILNRMPVKTISGLPGLLASYRLGEAVHRELPDLTDFIDLYKENLPMMNALYRDYSFLASAYLLEPCHERFVKGEPYGLARDVLPVQIARPMARCAEL
jgi:indoleamine 2,3-dioxygenase